MNQGLLWIKVLSWLKTVHCGHFDLINRYGIYVSQMRTDASRLSWSHTHILSSSFMNYHPMLENNNITSAQWSRSRLPLRSNWVHIQILMVFLLLNLNFAAVKSLTFCKMYFLLLCLFDNFYLVILLSVLRYSAESWVIVYLYYAAYDWFIWNLRKHNERWR